LIDYIVTLHGGVLSKISIFWTKIDTNYVCDLLVISQKYCK